MVTKRTKRTTLEVRRESKPIARLRNLAQFCCKYVVGGGYLRTSKIAASLFSRRFTQFACPNLSEKEAPTLLDEGPIARPRPRPVHLRQVKCCHLYGEQAKGGTVALYTLDQTSNKQKHLTKNKS